MQLYYLEDVTNDLWLTKGMTRKYYHIKHNQDGGWDFKLADSNEVIKHSYLKPELIRYAANYCKDHLSELVIHDHWGRIEDKRTFGDEQYPPKG